MGVAFVFPGQGSQQVGMGRAIAEVSAAARAVFEQADRALAEDPQPLSVLCFEGPLETLTLTANTQPAILATSIACLRALQERLPGLAPVMVAGHSLGEYAALVCAGALDFGETLRLVRLRGQFMQDAVPEGTGAMAAVMALQSEAVAELCEQVAKDLPGRTISPANFNSPGQTVVAGHADAVSQLAERVVLAKGKAVMLKVSAPFHCALMHPAADRLASALGPVRVSALSCPVVANVDARPNASPDCVKDLLVRQVVGTVRWEQSVKTMLEAGVNHFVEIGPGKVLSGLIKRIAKDVAISNVSDPESLEAAVKTLADS